MFNEIKDGIIKINKQQDTRMVGFEREPSRTYRNKKKNAMIKTKTNWRELTANQTQLKRDE